MQSLGLMIHDAARLLKAEFERRARAHKLSLMQWRVLGVLSKSDGLTQTALAHRVEASPMTISDILDRLETAGFVLRQADPQDSRAKIVRITSDAEPIVSEMRRIAAEVYDMALAEISNSDREALVRALAQISKNLDRASASLTEEAEA